VVVGGEERKSSCDCSVSSGTSNGVNGVWVCVCVCVCDGKDVGGGADVGIDVGITGTEVTDAVRGVVGLREELLGGDVMDVLVGEAIEEDTKEDELNDEVVDSWLEDIWEDPLEFSNGEGIVPEFANSFSSSSSPS